ncbi:MAG: DUF5615 family PIN-like protein [Candidatus Kapaibacterium sp.]
MKFLADMGISPPTVTFLCERGFDAVHLIEEELYTLSDKEILEKAWREGRIILTHDLDFSDLIAARAVNIPSVIFFRLKDMRPANVNRHLDAITAQHKDILSRSSVIISVTEKRIRLRSLPL